MQRAVGCWEVQVELLGRRVAGVARSLSTGRARPLGVGVGVGLALTREDGAASLVPSLRMASPRPAAHAPANAESASSASSSAVSRDVVVRTERIMRR